MSSPTPSERPSRTTPRFLLPASAWLIIAGAFAAGLLWSLLWIGQRGERASAPAARTPADVADAARPDLPAPQAADPAGATGLEEPDPDAPPRVAESPAQAPLQELPPTAADHPIGSAPTGAASAPVALDTPAPRYPSAALRRGESGEVLLQVLVGADGRPQQVDVLRGSGSRALDRAAVEAVNRWRFQPALRGGQPVQGLVQVPIVFSPGR